MLRDRLLLVLAGRLVRLVAAVLAAVFMFFLGWWVGYYLEGG